MDRFDITDENELKPNSSINKIIESAQGVAQTDSDTTVPTTSNGVLTENQTKIIGTDLYWMKNGIVVVFLGAEST